MISNPLKLLLIAICCQLFIACGSDHDSGGSANLALEGAWGFSCLEISSGKSTENQSRSFDFSQTTYSEEIHVYDDSACKTENLSRKISGTYSEGTKGDDATPINFVLSSVSMTVNDETTLSILNAESGDSDPICGGGWSKGVSKTLTTANCKDNTQNLPYSGLKVFDIYKIVDDTLLFGQKDSGLPTTAAARPSSIDEALSFLRK